MNLPKSFLVLTVSLILVLTASSVMADIGPDPSDGGAEDGGSVITPPAGSVSLILDNSYLPGQQIEVKVFNGTNETIYYNLPACGKPYSLCKINYGFTAYTAEEQPVPPNATCTAVQYLAKEMIGCYVMSTEIPIPARQTQKIDNWDQTYYLTNDIKAAAQLVQPGDYVMAFKYYTKQFSSEPVITAYTADIPPEPDNIHVTKTEGSTQRAFTIISAETPEEPITPPTPGEVIQPAPTKTLFKILIERNFPTENSNDVEVLIALPSAFDTKNLLVIARIERPSGELVKEKPMTIVKCSKWGVEPLPDLIPVQPITEPVAQTAVGPTNVPKITADGTPPQLIAKPLPNKNSKIQVCHCRIVFEGLDRERLITKVKIKYSDNTLLLEDEEFKEFTVKELKPTINTILRIKPYVPIQENQLITGTTYIANYKDTLTTENVAVKLTITDPSGKITTKTAVPKIEQLALNEPNEEESTGTTLVSNILQQITYESTVQATMPGKYRITAEIRNTAGDLIKTTETFFNAHYQVIAEPNECAQLREQVMKECKVYLNKGKPEPPVPIVQNGPPGSAEVKQGLYPYASILGWVAVPKARMAGTPTPDTEGGASDAGAAEGGSDSGADLIPVDDTYTIQKKSLANNIREIERKIKDCGTDETIKAFKVSVTESYNGPNCGNNKEEQCGKGNDSYVEDFCIFKDTTKRILVKREVRNCLDDSVDSVKTFEAGDRTNYFNYKCIDRKLEMCPQGLPKYYKEECSEIKPDPKTLTYRECLRAGLDKIKEKCSNPEIDPETPVREINIKKGKLIKAAVTQELPLPISQSMNITSTDTIRATVKTLDATPEQITVTSNTNDVSIASADGTTATTSLSVTIKDGSMNLVDGTTDLIAVTPKLARNKILEQLREKVKDPPTEFDLLKERMKVNYKAQAVYMGDCFFGLIKTQDAGTVTVNATDGTATVNKNSPGFLDNIGLCK